MKHDMLGIDLAHRANFSGRALGTALTTGTGRNKAEWLAIFRHEVETEIGWDMITAIMPPYCGALFAFPLQVKNS